MRFFHQPHISSSKTIFFKLCSNIGLSPSRSTCKESSKSICKIFLNCLNLLLVWFIKPARLPYQLINVCLFMILPLVVLSIMPFPNIFSVPLIKKLESNFFYYMYRHCDQILNSVVFLKNFLYFCSSSCNYKQADVLIFPKILHMNFDVNWSTGMMNPINSIFNTSPHNQYTASTFTYSTGFVRADENSRLKKGLSP